MTSTGANTKKGDDVDWQAVRLSYEIQNTPVADILLAYGLSRDRLYRRANVERWTKRTDTGKRQRTSDPSCAPPLDASATTIEKRAALAARLFHALEERILAIEEESLDHDASHGERDAKALTAMARALELLSQMLEVADVPATPQSATRAPGQETNNDEFRDLLKERLARLRQSET